MAQRPAERIFWPRDRERAERAQTYVRVAADGLEVCERGRTWSFAWEHIDRIGVGEVTQADKRRHRFVGLNFTRPFLESAGPASVADAARSRARRGFDGHLADDGSWNVETLAAQLIAYRAACVRNGSGTVAVEPCLGDA